VGKRLSRSPALPGGEFGMPKPFSDAQSIVGLLLGLFATVFSFLGITTGEVTSVLRNEPDEAPLVALLLLFGVLAAVLTVVVGDTADVAGPLDLAILIIVLIGVGTLVIRAIPIQGSKGLSLFWFVPIGVVAVAALVLRFRLGKQNPLRKKVLSVKVVLIVASVMLMATSVDAGLRLETHSQLQTTVQVSASVTQSDSGATLTVHLTAAKVTNDSSVRFEVGGINSGDSKKTILQNIASGDLDPDVNGDIDNTLGIPLLPGSYDTISIMTATCRVPNEASSPRASAASTPSVTAAPTSSATPSTTSSPTVTTTKAPVSKPGPSATLSSTSSATPASEPAAPAKAAPVRVDFTGCTMNSQLTIANPVTGKTS
jgi:hypothetical protein